MTRIVRALAILAAAISQSAFAGELNIVVTNDDGWSSPGIQALKRTLVDAGHNVYLVAPSDQQSGSSAAINTDRVEVTKQREISDEGALEFSVARQGGSDGAEPATAAMIGVSIVRQATGSNPDLVLSGINSGQNIGAAVQISGTIGAATAAITTVLGGGRIPGIAVSTDEPCASEEEPECQSRNSGQYDRVAQFVVTLIDDLSEITDGAALLPGGLGLNVNYPAVTGETPPRASINSQGMSAALPGQGAGSITFGCYEDCIAAKVGEPVPAGITAFAPIEFEEAPGTDTIANQAGFITIVPIYPDYTAGQRVELSTEAEKFLRKLNKTLNN